MGNGGASRNLELSAGALGTFKKRVDGILRDLEESKASHSKVSQQRLTRDALAASNSPFAEADGLYHQYNRVHRELTELSKTLKDQIEALQIAVHGVQVGFGNLEDDVKRRFWEIQGKTKDRELEAERRKHEHETGQKHTATDKKVER
ncbi:hypothetical protein [Streptomyces sp. ODS28]|uniref:hypothetical protein n=1 Tax=Streptomyces sp. ODS28 TaxID=3136688 RepID=UPI0031E86A8A